MTFDLARFVTFRQRQHRQSYCRTVFSLVTGFAILCCGRSSTLLAVDKADPASGMLDLTTAVVIAPDTLSDREKKAVEMLVDEVRKRSMIKWSQQQQVPVSTEVPVILVGPREKLRSLLASSEEKLPLSGAQGPAEGYQILSLSKRHLVAVIGNDERGVLFGVGRLLRELRMRRGQIEIPVEFQETSAPETPLRGHQLGYRQKTNSYDAWDIEQWEQYYRDLAVFGTNAIELIPPRSDDTLDSPHFPPRPWE